MPTNETELGHLTYGDRGDAPSYDWNDADHPNPEDMGLVQWLQRVELLGLPTYPTFEEVPDPSAPASDGDQHQFAAVVGDRTVYRTNGSEWVTWMGQGTTERPHEKIVTEEAHIGNVVVDVGNIGGISDHTGDRVDIAGNTYETIFDFAEAVDVIGGAIYGVDPRNVRLTFDDDSIDQYGATGRHQTTDEDVAVLDVLPAKDVKKMEFENGSGSEQNYGWGVMTI